MINKKGVTLASLVIYIILFTTFTVFVSNISTNENNKIISNRTDAVNYTNLSKLEYNIDTSCKNSTDVSFENNTLSFSNNDSYKLDSSSGILYKNNGIFCIGVSNFNVLIESKENLKKITIDITFTNITKDLTRKIINIVEEV